MAQIFIVEGSRFIDTEGSAELALLVQENGQDVARFTIQTQISTLYNDAHAFGEQWVKDNPTTPSAYVPPTLDELKAQAKQNVIAFASEIGAQLTADYPSVEREGWNIKLAEAKAIVAGETDPLNYPAIAAEISITGELATNVAPVIIAKAALFEKASGLISGVRQVTFIAIEAATSQAEIDIVINTARTTAETALAQLLS